ncbi:MAG: hypothetical protein KC621_18905 [Myxococcales bacterium]|nr:hypothetical protein [Myxococcales bacterium]
MLLLCAQALAQTLPSDVSISTLGVQSWTASALAETDVDAVLGQRLRWTLTDRASEGTAALLLVDARFTVDPTGGDPAFEWSQVRQLGVQLAGPKLTLDLGRAQVLRGGPRLVDGVQALVRATDTLEVGGWAGLQPDLFTTLPRFRPGVGPVVAYASPNVQASLVGDLTVYGGELDRVGALSMFRFAAERAAEVSARVDLEAVGDEGPRLVDGLLRASVVPVDAFRVDAFYDAFSSYLYQASTTLDPDRQRFDDRLGAISQANDLTQDTLDPRLNHLVGLGARVQPRTKGAAPRVLVEARDRFHPDPDNRFVRLHGQAGAVNLGGAVDVLADGNWIAVDGGTQIDAGLMAVVAPGPVSVDGSFRLLQVSDDDGGDLQPSGWYADLFLDVVSEGADLLLTAGVSVANEPDLDQQDRAYGAFLTMSKYVRPPRR